MKWKLKYAYFNEESGESFVIISTNLGNFDGSCKLHDEDKDIQSKFFGCRIAEMRAVAKYGKEKIKLLKNKVNTLKNLISELEKMNGYDKNSVEARFIRKQYFILQERLNRWNQNLINLQENTYNSMKNYRQDCENFHKKVEDRKQEPIKTE